MKNISVVVSALLLCFSPQLKAAGMSLKWTEVSKAEKITVNSDGSAVFSGAADGQRAYCVSTRDNWTDESFVFETVVKVPAGGPSGIAFIGLGSGTPNKSQWNEPSTGDYCYIRLSPSGFSAGRSSLVVKGSNVRNIDSPAPGTGTHRVRIVYDASRKLGSFEVDAHSKEGEFTADIVDGFSFKQLFKKGGASIFAGGAGGVVVMNSSVRPATSTELSSLTARDDFTGDKTAATWLPVEGKKSGIADADELLAALNASLRLDACWYKGPNLLARRTFRNGKLKTHSTEWKCATEITPVEGESNALDLNLTFTLEKGSVNEGGVAVAFDFADWSTNNYVLLPSSVYNGNRCLISRRPYASGIDRKYLYKKNLPLIINSTPHLALELGKPSRIEVNSCNMATPSMSVYDPKRESGLIILAEQGLPVNNGVINNGFIVEESDDRKSATLVVSSPGVRPRKPMFIGFSSSSDRGVPLKAGDKINMKLRIYAFDSDGIPGVLEKFMTVRKALSGRNSPRELVPFSMIQEMLTSRIDSRFTGYGRGRFYAPENADWISFGWIGGLINTFPMLALGDDLHFERVKKTFDFAIPAGQGKSGLYYGVLLNNGRFTNRDGYKDYPHFTLTRKQGDVLFWMIKQFMVLKDQGKGDKIDPEWEKSMQRLADTLVDIWKKEGEWGKIIDADTGRIAEYNTTSAAMVCGGLALAAEYFDKPEYLRVAKESADFYYERDFVKTGQTTGGIGDTQQNSDSESAGGFMTSLMAIYEVTGDGKWLEMSRNVANLVATWTTSYDYVLPRNTELARNGAKLTGIVWASTQNKHGAPGMCTSSCDPLFKIYRATGDRRYSDLMLDIVRCHAESIRPGGFTNERLTYCDADPHSVGNRGNHVTGWNEVNGILMAMELPGIYLRTDKDEIIVFDHVKAEVLSRSRSGVVLKITNPTKFNADVSVFAENASQAKKAQGYTAFMTWPKVSVPAGKSVTVNVSRKGKISTAE